jgi:hypothetical protein
MEVTNDSAPSFVQGGWLASYCFAGVYFVALLVDGYGLDPALTHIHWAAGDDGVEISWAVGAAVNVSCGTQ